MPNQKHPSKKDILAQWEKLVALHTRWKNDPSVQCAQYCQAGDKASALALSGYEKLYQQAPARILTENVSSGCVRNA